MDLQAIQKFHKTRLGYIVFGLVELGLSYLLFSLAINSGNLWEYILAIILLFGALQNFVRMWMVHKK